jgi:hypothetical protein
VRATPKEATSNYSKTALIDDLKIAGFDDGTANTIADKVDKLKGENWTYDMGRQEAIKQAQTLLQNAHNALDSFRSGTLASTGQQDHYQREQPYAGQVGEADSNPA